jgi:hypothetical protein
MKLWMKYGVIAGVLLCLPMFGPLLLFGPKPEWMKVGEIVGYASMFLCLTVTYFAMRRQQLLHGPLSYAQALGTGVGVSAVAGCVFGIATWICFVAAGDQMPEALMQFYTQQIKAADLSAEVRQKQLEALEAMRPMLYNRPLQAAVMAATVFVIGVVVSLISAWLLVRGRGVGRVVRS